MNDEDRAALENELEDIEAQTTRLRNEVRSITDDLREGDEAGSSRIAVEQLTLIETLERRRAELESLLFGTDAREAVDNPAGPSDSPWPRGDELTEVTDMDDEVDALELGALSAATEDSPDNDSTELADRAAPPAPEEIADDARTPADVDHMETGLAPGVDLDSLEKASDEQLFEAQMAAIDEADPETVALIRDEIEQRRRA